MNIVQANVEKARMKFDLMPNVRRSRATMLLNVSHLLFDVLLS